MDIVVPIFVLLIYLSLLYEIVGIPVPSVASTYQLLFTSDGAYEVDFSGAVLLSQVRAWGWPLKVALLLLPTMLGVCVYLTPLLLAVWPPAGRYFHFLYDSFALGWPLIIGGLVALFGRVIGLKAAQRMQGAPETTVDFSLRTDGIFARTRNPILLGMIIPFAGLWLIYPTWEMLIGLLIFVGNMHFRVLLEEDFLLARYGEPYRQFFAKTQRYL